MSAFHPLQTFADSPIVLDMNDDDTCICERHGLQPIAFVCKHITGVPGGETVGFVSGPPEDESDLRDAWCDDCHSFLKDHGGEWVEGSAEVPDGIIIICAGCYREREADAERAGRRVIYRAS